MLGTNPTQVMFYIGSLTTYVRSGISKGVIVAELGIL